MIDSWREFSDFAIMPKHTLNDNDLIILLRENIKLLQNSMTQSLLN